MSNPPNTLTNNDKLPTGTMNPDDIPPHDEELDARGMICPLPSLRTRRKLQDMNPGDILLVQATDPDAPQDIYAVCHVGGHEYLGVVEILDKNNNRLFEIHIKRGHGDNSEGDEKN